YKVLAEWKGKPEAIAWLTKEVPPDKRLLLAATAFHDGEGDLLWDAIDQPGKTGQPDFIWLLRAGAAFKKTSDQADPHKNELTAYYSQPRPKDPIYSTGRCVLGLMPDDDLLRLVQDNKDLRTVAFFLGWKAEATNRFNDASD